MALSSRSLKENLRGTRIKKSYATSSAARRLMPAATNIAADFPSTVPAHMWIRNALCFTEPVMHETASSRNNSSARFRSTNRTNTSNYNKTWSKKNLSSTTNESDQSDGQKFSNNNTTEYVKPHNVPLSCSLPKCMNITLPSNYQTLLSHVVFIDAFFPLSSVLDRISCRDWKSLKQEYAARFPKPRQSNSRIRVIIPFSNPSFWQKDARRMSFILNDRDVYTMFSVPPHRASEFNEPTMLSVLAAHRDKVVAIGPIGSTTEQDVHLLRRVFKAQVRIAVKEKLPIVVEEKGDQSVLEWLTEDELLPSSHPIYFHSFEGSESYAAEWMERFPRTFFGVNASAMREDSAAHFLPLTKIVAETGSPRYTGHLPNCVDDKSPEMLLPGDIMTLYTFIACAKKSSNIEKAASRLSFNAMQLFNIS